MFQKWKQKADVLLDGGKLGQVDAFKHFLELL